MLNTNGSKGEDDMYNWQKASQWYSSTYTVTETGELMEPILLIVCEKCEDPYSRT